MDRVARERWLEPRTLLSQWAGVLLGPAAWALHLQVSYTLAALACDDAWRFSIHAMTALSLVVALTGLYVARRNWQASLGGAPDGHRLDRSRFMAIAGLGLSAFFAIVITAQWIPTLFLEPCRY